MTEYDPYRDIDDIIDEIDGNDTQDKPRPSSEDQAKPSPQPVTDPVNPFYGSRYADAPSQPTAHPTYGASGNSYYKGAYENPFLAQNGPVPVPAHRAPAVPPERQANLTMHKLNTWLSVFLPIASVIFFFIDRDKERVYDQHLRETMNMGITRMFLTAGFTLASGFVGGIFGLLSMVYFILALLGALEAQTKYIEGSPIRYKGAIPFTRKDDI